MLWAPGHHRFDLTHRALVLALVEVTHGGALQRPWPPGGPPPDGVVVAGDRGAPAADVARTVRDLDDALDGPILVRTSSADVLTECLAAGAVGGHDPAGVGGADYLAAARSAGAAVIAGAPLTAPAGLRDRPAELVALVDRLTAEGFPRERIGVDPSRTGSGVAPAEVVCLDEIAEVAVRGAPVLVEVRAGDGSGDDVRAGAACAVLAARGARLLVTTHVRTARRVVAVMEELLRAHADTRPDPEVRP